MMPLKQAYVSIIAIIPVNALYNANHLSNCGFSISTLANKQLKKKGEHAKMNLWTNILNWNNNNADNLDYDMIDQYESNTKLTGLDFFINEFRSIMGW